MSDDVVLYELQDGVATLTLNRPDRRNAWTIAMHKRYWGLLEQCDDDPEVRVVVVTGAGSSFCPGADTDSLQGYTASGEFDPLAATITQPDWYPMTLRKPVIAAINGACAGFGLAVAMMTDVRIAVSGARMTTAFARRGLPALHGVAWLLPRLVGVSRATELILSGRTFTSDEAASIGLVNQLVEPGTALDAARAYAADLVANCSPTSWMNIKQQLLLAGGQTFPEAVEEAAGRELPALSSRDFYEGVFSFVERRPARFAPLGEGHLPRDDQ